MVKKNLPLMGFLALLLVVGVGSAATRLSETYLNGTTYVNSTNIYQDGNNVLDVSSSFSGDISGNSSNIVVADDLHNHSCSNITGATDNDFCTDTANTTAEVLAVTNNTAHWTAEAFVDTTDGVEWIKPEHISDVDDADIETDLNTYVDIAGDDMTDDLNIDGNLNATGNFTVNSTSLFVDSSIGKVGIGTTIPTAKLEVNGSINVTGNINFTGNLRIEGCIIYNCTQAGGCATLGVCV